MCGVGKVADRGAPVAAGTCVCKGGGGAGAREVADKGASVAAGTCVCKGRACVGGGRGLQAREASPGSTHPRCSLCAQREWEHNDGTEAGRLCTGAQLTVSRLLPQLNETLSLNFVELRLRAGQEVGAISWRSAGMGTSVVAGSPLNLRTCKEKPSSWLPHPHSEDSSNEAQQRRPPAGESIQSARR